MSRETNPYCDQCSAEPSGIVTDVVSAVPEEIEKRGARDQTGNARNENSPRNRH